MSHQESQVSNTFEVKKRPAVTLSAKTNQKEELPLVAWREKKTTLNLQISWACQLTNVLLLYINHPGWICYRPMLFSLSFTQVLLEAAQCKLFYFLPTEKQFALRHLIHFPI